MLRKRKLTCVLPLYGSSVLGGELVNKNKRIDHLIKEIQSYKEYTLPFTFDKHNSKIKIEAITDIKYNERFEFPYLIKPVFHPFATLIFTVRFSDKISESKIHLFERGLFDAFNFIMQTLFCAINIAYLGSLSIKDRENCITLLDGKKTIANVEFGGDFFDLISNFNEKYKIIEMSDLNLKDVWRWFLKFNDIFSGFSKSQVGRTINTLKFIGEKKNLGHQSFIPNMIWIVLALEILYLRNVSSDLSKTGELKKRISNFLNAEIQSDIINEQKIGKLYGYRSRFLHGDVDIPGPNFPIQLSIDNRNKEFDMFYIETEKTMLALGLIVIQTLKKLIYKNWNGLEFNVVYTPKST